MIHYPYWSCYDGLGQKYCDCSHEKYAIRTLELHEGEGFTYKRIDAPKPLPPYIVDVTAEYEGELPGQQGLPKATERLHEDIRQKRQQLEESKLAEADIDGEYQDWLY
jgi:hypothetical protein|tara:strand:- start:2168 stop:2491 length:324 start_codon:yes stop_codon:yes gene_type:complete